MAASRDVVSGAPAHALRPTVSARACLEHLCRALASLGVGVVPTEDASRGSGDRPRRALTAETLRRAKFDHPDASAPLWRAIHDLFLVAAAGFPDPSVAADALARVRGDSADVDREAEDATCAALARHHLAEAGYPRARDLARLPPRDGRSRPLLLALAWAVHRADVFARAHADAHAPPLASAAPGASQSPLPPYPPDSAASPAAARAAAVPALALERAYFEDARAALDACRDEHDDPTGDPAAPSSSSSSSASSASAARLGRRREPLPLAARAAARVRAEAARDAGVRAQTPIFAQRLWQTLSHVEALERARATRRRRLRDARREFAAGFGDPSSAPARTPLPSSAYEVLLSRDANARRKHAAAMEATMEAQNAASDAVSSAETFYAWVESALELEDRDRAEDEDEADERRKDEENDDVRSEGEPSSSSNVSSDPNGRSRSLGDALRAVECAARRVGPALRSRRRGVEAVADAWALARRRAEEDDDEAERLAKRSERAANGLPKFETFLAVRRGGVGAREDDESEDDTDERLRRRERATERRFAQENASLAGLAPAMFADATPPPEDVEAALIARGATLRKVKKAMNVGDGDGGVSSRVETRGRVSRSGSVLGGASSSEAPEEAAARLGELARASEAALARTRRRARTFLASRVEAVFGRDEEGDPAPAVYTGWSE